MLFNKMNGTNVSTPSKLMERSQNVLPRTFRGGITWYTKLFIVWIFFALVGSVKVFQSINADIKDRRKEMLVSKCDERARMLQDRFQLTMNQVHGLAELVSLFHYKKQPSAIDEITFAQYTARTSFVRPLMSGVAFAQKVLHSEREKFEKEQGWTIKDMKSREPSPEQDEYAPAIFPQETVWYIKSLDMMSGKEDRENILRARSTGKAVLTSPFRLLESSRLGVITTFTVYNSDITPDASPDKRIHSTVGYLGGAFDVESLVENLLKHLSPNFGIVVSVYDITNRSMPLIMYGPHAITEEMMHTSPLDFGDPFRKHEILCRYQDKPQLSSHAITSAIVMFVIAVLVGYILHASFSRIERVQEGFRKMEELKMRAEAADVAKSQFLATISHEIRTPMNGVLGMLQMLLDTNMDATQSDFARTAQASGKALITLINEVLDRAKIDSGRLELEQIPFNMRLILEDVLSLFSSRSRDKVIELAAFVSDHVPEVIIGDPGRFRQIITNIVGNAVKFTEKGHVFIHVNLAEKIQSVIEMKESHSKVIATNSLGTFETLSGRQTADGRNSWETFKLLLSDDIYPSIDNSSQRASLEASDTINITVMVEDTGIGIPIKTRELIFTPYIQADSYTSQTLGGGTGLGLSISKCLVELMGGNIDFVSHPLIGSTFTFTVPLKRGSITSLAEMKEYQPEPVMTEFEGMNAIIVDGRQVRAMVTKYHLKRIGIKVEVSSTIKSILPLLSEKKRRSENEVDLILVDKDCWGPGTGIEFPLLLKSCIRKEREEVSIKIPKIILLATSITSAESDHAKAAGFVETIIMKPVIASMVAACLKQALSSKRKQEKGLMGGSSLQRLMSGKRILVVDDNRVNRRVAAGALKKFGANVDCADSGKAAIEMLKLPHKFDVCFMDIQMPEMDGFEATRQIRDMERSVSEQIDIGKTSTKLNEISGKWHVPVFAMTADVIQTTHEECLRYGMDGYVPKPFSEGQFKILTITGKRRITIRQCFKLLKSRNYNSKCHWGKEEEFSCCRRKLCTVT